MEPVPASHPYILLKSSDFEIEKLSFFLLKKHKWVYYDIRETDFSD